MNANMKTTLPSIASVGTGAVVDPSAWDQLETAITQIVVGAAVYLVTRLFEKLKKKK